MHFANMGAPSQLAWPWSLPLGRFSLGMDDLSVIFLLPILLISALGSIYGLEYWKQSRHPGDGRKLRFCWGLLAAAMMLVVLARDGVLFLIAWEIMALAGFFLITTEDKKSDVRWAGWVYLVAAHCGTMCLFATFGFLHFASGSFELWPKAAADFPHGLRRSCSSRDSLASDSRPGSCRFTCGCPAHTPMHQAMFRRSCRG